MNSPSDVWGRVLELLSKNLSSTAITTWFEDCEIVELAADQLVIHASSNFKRDVIKARFLNLIKDALKDIFASDFDVLVLGGDEVETYNLSKKQMPSAAIDGDVFTFERFVVGNSNKFAHAAAIAVAENPAGAYNPLFIYGDSGLGKTHLLYAISHSIKNSHPDFKIVYIKGDDFTNELIYAIQTGKNIEFREKYRSADLFLVDDIQFIAGKVQTQEEFFHTFNTLFEGNRQIVMTSDRPPKEILRLEDRLKSRFESGLLADIQPPDYETRMAIIKNKAQQLGLSISDEVADYIAQNITSNVRQIEGTVKKLLAYRDLLDNSITLPSVSKAIKDMFKDNTAYLPTPEIIISETAQYYSLSPEDVRGQKRTHNTALARQISMYLIRKLTNLSLKDIGAEFENRDHTTVLSSIRRIETNIRTSESFADTIKDISANINSKN